MPPVTADPGPSIPSYDLNAAFMSSSLLRWIYCLVVHGTSWDPAVAAGLACQPEAA